MRYMSILASSILLSVSSSAFAVSSTKWTVSVEEDGFTDSKKVFAVVAAKGGFNKGFIHMGCYPSGFEGKVGTGQYIGDKDISYNVRYRVDKSEPVKTTMKPTREKYVYFNDESEPFLLSLMNGNSKVLIETTSYDFDRSRAEFTLKGSTKAIKQVLDACKGKY